MILRVLILCLACATPVAAETRVPKDQSEISISFANRSNAPLRACSKVVA